MRILVPLLCAAAGWTAELLPGESAGPDLIGASGLATALAAGRCPFADSPGSGGSARIAAGPDGPCLVVEESNAGAVANAGSSLRWAIPGDSPLVRRINELLARPEGEPPATLAFSWRVRRLAAASRPIWLGISLSPSGGRRWTSRCFVGSTDLRRHAGYRAGAPAIDLDAATCPGFRFLVPASGGRQRIDDITLALDLRVEGDSTAERLAIDRLVVHEIQGPPIAGPNGSLAMVGSAPPLPLLAAARRSGWTVQPTREDAAGPAADLLIVQRRIDDAAAAAPVVAALDAGTAVLFAVADAGRPAPALEERLPANAWSWAQPNLQRGDSGASGTTGGPWEGITRLAFLHRYDLHLPGAPIENGLMRYQWERYAKGPLVGDWRCELAATVDGRLPLLVTGRSGAGRASVLAAELSDPVFTASPDAERCCAALLAWAKPQPIAAAGAGDPAALVVAVPPLQPDGLTVTVRNPGKEDTDAVLSWKTCSWGREHLVARSQALRVPAGGTLRVALEDGTPGEAIPWRRIDAAILPPGRDRVLTRALAAVATAAPVQVGLETDPADDPWPAAQARANNEREWSDGRLARRVLYTAGAAPKLSVIASNGRLDLAPLATARDLGYPENPSSGGINDLSWSLANVRGAGPWQGGWSGRPAAEQRLELSWPMPVTVVGQRLHGYGSFRRWNQANPLRHQVLGDDGKTLFATAAAVFATRGSETHAYCDEDFAAPAILSRCVLAVGGLDPKANPEPHHIAPSNCSLAEWEVFGWPGAAPPPVDGELTVTATDLLDGRRVELLHERIALAAGAQAVRAIVLPAHPGPGPVRIEVSYGGAVAAHELLFVPAGVGIVAKESLADGEKGLLCSPGFAQTLEFGLGMRSQTQGWGGDDDKIWALVHGMMETGAQARDQANRLFTTPDRFCHYTSPWRETPSGAYGWDLAARAILDRAVREKKERMHVIGSDRWNGINVWASWGWDTFMAFDRHLREGGGPGLAGRTRGEVARDIAANHGDEWQRWQMRRYADKLLATQAAFAEAGKAFSFESHGSFPLAGGQLGADLAKTHRSVGTDLFWELRNQDLYWTIGTRFALIAANPSLASGAYGQWGWDNSDCNQWWFANNGGADTARRQWYATYFAGRIALDGAYHPYHATGFSMQGDVGTRVYPDDMQACVATAEIVSRVRPEAAAGCTIALSWATQERRMGRRLANQGFGLYAGAGHEQVDQLFARAYERLARNGLALGTVTAGEALARWQGTQPLVLVDGFAWPEDQLAEVARLNRAGAPVLVIGDAAEAQGDAAAALCGVHRDGDAWSAAAGTERIELPGATAFLRPGPAPVLWCPLPVERLGSATAQALAADFLARCGDPLRLPPGVACTPLLSQGRLWLPLCEQGDAPRDAAVSLRPEAFGLAGPELRAIDIERGEPLAIARAADGRVTIPVRLPGSGGRLILISPEGKP